MDRLEPAIRQADWPWGWTRTWNIAQPAPAAYTPAPGENEFTWYSSHNPTPTQNLVFDSWHSGGLQAIDVSDPGLPTQTGWFSATRCQPWPMRTRPCPAGRTRS
jgi:hypothetical protein